VIRPEPQQPRRRRQQAVQVERAGAAGRGALGDQTSPRFGRVAQLSGQDPRALQAQRGEWT
jgi:hypothetical protein